MIIERKVILVTGGGSYDGFNRIFGSSDSTEVLEDIAWTWRLTSTLPHSRDGLRAAVLDNNINVCIWWEHLPLPPATRLLFHWYGPINCHNNSLISFIMFILICSIVQIKKTTFIIDSKNIKTILGTSIQLCFVNN